MIRMACIVYSESENITHIALMGRPGTICNQDKGFKDQVVVFDKDLDCRACKRLAGDILVSLQACLAWSKVES